MARAKGHLRLILSEEDAQEDTAPAETSVRPVVAVDKVEVVFTCPECSRVSWAGDRKVIERWCTGGQRGVRTHAPVQMERQERP